MPFNLDPSLGGWFVVGTMITSGFILGTVSDKLLQLIGVRDRFEKR